MVSLRPRLSVIVLGVAAVVLLATVGTRATLESRRPCRGTIEAESIWEGGDDARAQKRAQAAARARTLTARRPAVIVRDERTAGWQEGGTYERDWRMGDLVAYERGGYYRSSYPSIVTVGLANACDDRTVVHDGYHTGTLEARHDPDTGLWYAVTMSGGIATIATPIRIVEKPAIRFTPKASLFFFAGGALAFVLTLLLFVRGRRFARLQRLEEVIVVGKDGRTTIADGTALTLVPPPPLGSVVLVVDVQAEGARTDPYRERPERTTARWVPWTRDRARHQETTALALAAALYVVTMGLGVAALMQTS